LAFSTSRVAGQAGASLSAPRVFLTWPRALAVCALLLLFVGGRGADFFLIALGLVLWFAVRAVGAAADGLVVGLRLLDHHVALGSPALLEVTVRNRSHWPIPLLVLALRLPEGVPGEFRRVLTLGPRASRRFTLRLTGLRRGVYRLGEARVLLADWFGLRTETGDAPGGARFVVYPALLRLPAAAEERRLPVGPRRDPASPFRDEQPVGVRPYLRGDPLRLIAWKATAHRGELLVRDLPPVRETASWVLLDLDGDDWDPLNRHRLGEEAVTLAASLVWARERAGRRVGFAAWAALCEQSVHGPVPVAPGAWVRLPPRADEGHALRLLEVLAGLAFAPGGDFPARLRAEADRLPWGAEVLVLVARDTPDLWQAGAALAVRGHPVTFLVFERRLGRPEGLRGGPLPRVLEVHVGDGISFR
jgi:uncharacterized protein (DUF58 family)